MFSLSREEYLGEEKNILAIFEKAQRLDQRIAQAQFQSKS